MTREPDPITSYADTSAAPVLLIGAAATVADAIAAVHLVGARLLDRIDWADAPRSIGRHAVRPVVLLEVEGTANAAVENALPALAMAAEALNLQVVVALPTSQIDLVSAHLMGERAQMLCEPTVADRIVALTIAIEASHRSVLHDSWRESEVARLQRLHEEVARIAEILTQLTHTDQSLDVDLKDRRRGYDAGPGEHGDIAAQEVRHAIRARRLRDQYFGEGLFEDPAWDMFLDLYAAELEGARVSVSSLCIASSVAPTTALRWISKLTDSSLLVRHPDTVDRRRAFMTLAPQVSEAMRGYMLAVKRADLKLG